MIGRVRRTPGTRKRILLISMYPLDAGMWGPTVRIAHMREELAELVAVDVIDGYRGARRGRLWRYAVSGRLRGLDGIYVEASSFLPAEIDVAFLALARALGIPVLTYFRDAYQLFPEYYPVDSARRWLAARAFVPVMRALGAASTLTAAPSAGLGRALFGSRWDGLLLPPGASAPVDVEYDANASTLLYVGDARLQAQGAATLIAAVERLRASGRQVDLRIVAREGQEPPPPRPPWVRVERAQGDEIVRLLHPMVATVIPRPRGAYNDLALPIKLFDYLSYARPLLVTACAEQARVVTDSGAGMTIRDDVTGMADDIAGFLDLAADERVAMAKRAAAAARAASWRGRALAVLSALGVMPDGEAHGRHGPSVG
jgi:hypothetical protein